MASNRASENSEEPTWNSMTLMFMVTIMLTMTATVTPARIDPTAFVLEQWAATLLAPCAVKNPTGSPHIRLKQFSTSGTLTWTDRKTKTYL